MPIPKPRPLESKDKYLQRCMINAIMIAEYPEISRRFAVCSSTYEDSQVK